ACAGTHHVPVSSARVCSGDGAIYGGRAQRENATLAPTTLAPDAYRRDDVAPPLSSNAEMTPAGDVFGLGRSIRTASAPALIGCLACVLFFARPAHALDPDKRISQYLRTSWRLQNGSAPASMFTVAQTSDGFIWFSVFSPWIYRFDGVRFRTVAVPSKDGSVNK